MLWSLEKHRLPLMINNCCFTTTFSFSFLFNFFFLKKVVFICQPFWKILCGDSKSCQSREPRSKKRCIWCWCWKEGTVKGKWMGRIFMCFDYSLEVACFCILFCLLLSWNFFLPRSLIKIGNKMTSCSQQGHMILINPN